MKTQKRAFKIFLCCMTFVISSQGNATLRPDHVSGEKVIELTVPGKRSEICVIPNHLPGANYSAKDLEEEQELCKIHRLENAAVCPKTNSTNPGLNFFSLPSGATTAQQEAAKCALPEIDKLAKYKLSTSCSYTPSLLGYYHVSRILGEVAQVPPAVLRTFDLETHIQMAKKALAQTPAADLIHQTWLSLYIQLQAGTASSKKDLLFTDHFDQSYGALQKNAGGETFYKEFFNSGADALTRAQNFRDKNPIVRLLADPRAASELVARQMNAGNLQKLVQMKDASEMIILDTLLSQQDRFGNMHSQVEYFFYEQKADGSTKLKSKKKPTPEEKAKAVAVKKLILKDNDCGVSKTNIALQANLTAKLAHLDPRTYRRLVKFKQIIDEPQTKAFFMDELQFTRNDFQNFQTNLKTLAGKLQSACEQGRVKLDLDLDTHFSSRPLNAVSCTVE